MSTLQMHLFSDQLWQVSENTALDLGQTKMFIKRGKTSELMGVKGGGDWAKYG